MDTGDEAVLTSYSPNGVTQHCAYYNFGTGLGDSMILSFQLLVDPGLDSMAGITVSAMVNNVQTTLCTQTDYYDDVYSCPLQDGTDLSTLRVTASVHAYGYNDSAEVDLGTMTLR